MGKNKRKSRRHKKTTNTSDHRQDRDKILFKGIPQENSKKIKSTFWQRIGNWKKAHSFALAILIFCIPILISAVFFLLSPSKKDLNDAVKTTLEKNPDLLKRPFKEAMLELGLSGTRTLESAPTLEEIKHSAEEKYPGAEERIIAKAESAQVFMDDKQYDKAIEAYKALISFYPEMPEFHRSIAQCYLEIEDFDAASREYAEVIKVSPRDTKAHTNLGWALIRLGNYSSSIRESRKAVEIDSTNKVALLNLGSAYGDIKQYDSAKAAYKQALHPDPRYPTIIFANAYLGLGSIYQSQDSLPKAAELYLKAISFDTTNVDNAFILHNLAQVYHKMGKLDMSIDALRKALAFRPELGATRYNLAQALSEKGRNAEAEFQFKMIFATDPTYFKSLFSNGDSVKAPGGPPL